MIHVTIKKSATNIIGFQFDGHAGYAEAGEDIVCAGVSALVLNTINSIEALTNARFTCEMKEEDGFVSFELVDTDDREADLLLQSLYLGVNSIQETYNDYIQVTIREV